MSVRMTEIASSVFNGAQNIDVPVEELFTEAKLDFELVSSDSGLVEKPVESNAFTQVGEIIGKMIVSSGLVEDNMLDAPSVDIEHTEETKPEIDLPHPDSELNPEFQAAITDEISVKRIDEIPDEAIQSVALVNNRVRTANPDKILSVLAHETRVRAKVPPNEITKIRGASENLGIKYLGVTERSSAQSDDKAQHIVTPSVQTVSINNETLEPNNSITALDGLKNTSETDVVNIAQTSILRISPSLTPTVQPASIGAQTPDSKILSQVSLAISSTSKEKIEIRLDPPELGRIIISINQSDSGLSALVSSEKAEIADLLRRHSELLSRELSKSGFDDATLEFSHREKHPDGSAFESAQNNFPSDASEQSEASFEVEGVLRSISGGLDIRL